MHEEISIKSMRGVFIKIYGMVQGVGFRPAVWRLATHLELAGSVWNEGGAVFIQAWGVSAALDEFIRQLPIQTPAAAKINRVEWQDLQTAVDCAEFSIVPSRCGRNHLAIAPDFATCQHCLNEVLDCTDHRYRHAFNSCTQCGPRLSIIRSLPYDRGNTSMAGFDTCPACQSEYLNPADRRFHAQTIACPVCGPSVWLEDGFARSIVDQEPLAATAALIGQGYIIAIKGLGGFHLVCDAGNQKAVMRLRQRKQRMDKPFAIMARDAAMLENYVYLDERAQQLLNSSAAPIVLLDKKNRELAAAIAPRQLRLGCLLPYTPLHHLLFHSLDKPVVFTSGNRSDEPPATDNAAARNSLSGIADYWLMHNRDIVNRLDDSVQQFIDQRPRMLRRARGYAPLPMNLPPGFVNVPPILAMGAELKNTFCLIKAGQAILSPHIGDLENALIQTDYRQQLDRFQQLFQFQPQHIAVDFHPGYLSTQLGQAWAAKQQLSLINVQHHHAHIAAVMAEYALPIDTPPVLGVVMDGLGMGESGQLWGGEFLQTDYRQFRRLASFQPVCMPGGAQAIRQPWRNTYAHLSQYFDWVELGRQYAGLDIIRLIKTQPLHILDVMLANKLNSPLSSSCGRCLDAFAAALGVCSETISYEAQAAIELETLATPVFRSQKVYAYPYETVNDSVLTLLCWRPFWQALLDDLYRGTAIADIAARIHHGLANAIADTAIKQADSIATQTVILSGGVFQNRLLQEEVSLQLRLAGKIPLASSAIPCNDGGLAFGQAVIAAARLSADSAGSW